MKRILLGLIAPPVLAAAFAACGPAALGGDDDPGNNPDAGPCQGDDCPPPPPPPWSFKDVHGVPNLDDDDGQAVDWSQPTRAINENDLSRFVIPASALAQVPDGGDVALALTGDTTKVRVYRDGQRILGDGAAPGPYLLAPGGGGDVVLEIEFGDFAARAQLTLDARDAAGQVVEAAAVALQASPLIMNHHDQPAEHVWVVAVNGNASMIAAYRDALGDKFTAIPGSAYRGDVWVQDEFEFATLTGEDDLRLDVVIDSIRNRGIDGFKQQLRGDDTLLRTWGTPGQATTYDSFGNLEATPPITVNGVAYPFGKIYYGRVGNAGLNTQLGSFLASQQVQAPFQLPTNWLCVGHVDEFSSFLPDPSSPKGFKLVMADVNAAYAIIDAMPSSTVLTRYGADHGYPTAGALAGDAALRALNADIQTDYLDPITAKFKAELGLTDDDIIKLPSLFETVGGCGGRVAALIPGMANLVVANVDGQTTHVFTADPFFRPSGASQATDPLITAFTGASPAGLTFHYVDDWNVYHLGLGEVHCGTNVRRTPVAQWWTTAQHLVGGN